MTRRGPIATLLGLFSSSTRRTSQSKLSPTRDQPPEPDSEETDPPVPETVEIPITDVLDLHSFQPAEVKDVVRDYLDAAYALGLRELRIIHGRGIGVQRTTVQTLLERDSRVVEFSDAPGDAGGWGATIVRME